MLKRFLMLFLVVMQFGLWGEEHKAVYMISGPRALSTVFLRMMESREDFVIYNEPTVPFFVREKYQEFVEQMFRENANKSFAEVKEKIFTSLKTSNVFIKDMSFSTYECLLKDTEFMKNPSVHFLFLVRNPHHSSISFYQMLGDTEEGMSEIIGLRQLYEEYSAVRKSNPNSVKIIFAEQLYESPREMMKAVCDHLKIPFSEKAFNWKKYDHSFQGDPQWNEQKRGEHIQHWHGRVIQSVEVGKPNTYEVDEKGSPTFAEIDDEDDRMEMIKAYRDNMVYYEKFQQAKDDHLHIGG